MPQNIPEEAPALTGRRLHKAAVLTLLGFLAGLVLYFPWDTVWDFGLHRLAARIPDVRVRWQSVDRAGPLGFRVNGLSIEGPRWPFAPRLASVDVRLGMSPRLAMNADTGGGTLAFVLLDDGEFNVSGAAALSCLGRRDITGTVDVRGQGRMTRTPPTLRNAILDLRGKSLKLPGGLLLGDAGLALEYKDGLLSIRSFTLLSPVQVRAVGTAVVRPRTLLSSPYSVSGDLLRGQTAIPFNASGRLGDFLGEATLPQ